jgi:hypothetical protein
LFRDKPVSYPSARGDQGEVKSLGFWYGNGETRESVVVILRSPPVSELTLRGQIHEITNILTGKLKKSKRLPSVYEFSGHRLR